MAPKPIPRWTVYIFRSSLKWLGEVEAGSEAEALAKAAVAYNQPPARLIAVRR